MAVYKWNLAILSMLYLLSQQNHSHHSQQGAGVIAGTLTVQPAKGYRDKKFFQWWLAMKVLLLGLIC